MVSTPLDRPVTEVTDVSGNPERPILVDLMEVGVYANSMWDLVHSAAPFTRARGVLRRHAAHGDHPPEVAEALRLALARLG